MIRRVELRRFVRQDRSTNGLDQCAIVIKRRRLRQRCFERRRFVKRNDGCVETNTQGTRFCGPRTAWRKNIERRWGTMFRRFTRTFAEERGATNSSITKEMKL